MTDEPPKDHGEDREWYQDFFDEDDDGDFPIWLLATSLIGLLFLVTSCLI